MLRFVTALLALVAVSATAAPEKPNIIYILADDLGYGDLGCYGGKTIQTPRIDQMRSEGLKFTQHYSGSCMCAPTRACLMTGLHTGHARVRANGSHLQSARVPLLDEDVTVAEVLKNAGYATGVIGKWGLGEEGSSGIPNRQGFDFWFGYLNQSNAHHYYPPFLWRNEEQVLYPDNPEKRTHYSHDLFTEEGLRFIKEHREGSFFLYMAYTIPHVDLDVPDDSKEPYIGKIEETEPYGTPGGQHYRHETQPHATFAGMVSRLDRDVGRLLDLVKELNLEENTLVIFTSDNGPTSAGGADPKFFDGNGPLRGIKFEFYEGGIRAPMIARWPGVIEAGTETDHISAHWDMLPTFAELAGMKAPKDIDGTSMAPLLSGDAAGQKPVPFLYWEGYARGGEQVVRRGPWKAIRTKVIDARKTAFELYNLDADLAETTNVAEQNPDLVAELTALMAANHKPNDHFAFKPGFTKPKKNKKK
jgi:arylsulfatase A-like enzyme